MITRRSTHLLCAYLAFLRFLLIEFVVATPIYAQEQTSNDSPRQAFLHTQSLSPLESMRVAKVHRGFRLELVAAEPLVADPVAIDFAPDGRLWVAEMADYPLGMDGQGKAGGRVRFLEDSDHNGTFDRSTVFLEGLSFPTSVLAWRDGVLVTAAPELIFAQDTDGDGKADRKTPLFRGFIEGNQQLRVNSLVYGLDHWVYCAGGGHHAGFGAETTITNERTHERHSLGSRDFRFQPDSGRFDPISGPSQFGRVRDDWGNWFGVQNSFPLWHYVLEDAYLRRNPRGRYPDARNQLRLPMQPRVFPAKPPEKRYHGFDHVGRYTSACGPSIYRDRYLFDGTDTTHAFTCEPFHNVVQHHALHESGVSFVGDRAPTTEPFDFFASSDQWCRPVFTRTGPDGALWIVDMYRFMIEHPEWLPPEGQEELRPYYRDGEGLGRIYRIVRDDRAPPAVPRLDRSTPIELCAYLEHDNGVIRDWAQRLLIEHNDRSVIDRLRSLAQTHGSPRTRLHSLATLAGMQAIDEALVTSGLHDAHPAVRRFAIRLLESIDPLPDRLIQDVVRMTNDPEAAVRLQLAFTLGAIENPLAATALAELAQQTQDDLFLNAAVISSAERHYASLMASLRPPRRVPPILQDQLLSMGSVHPEALADFLSNWLQMQDEAVQADRFRVVSAWVDSLHEEGSSPKVLAAEHGEAWQPILAKLADLQEMAWRTALEPTTDPTTRAAALGMLHLDSDRITDERETLVDFLLPHHPPSVQMAAVRAFDQSLNAITTSLLLIRWSQYSSDVRQALADLMMQHPAAAQLFLDQLGAGAVNRLDLDATRRDRWIHHADPAIADRAAKLFLSPIREERQAVIERYRAALSSDTVVSQGELVYRKHCANCHEGRDGSPPIGPDLRSLSDRSNESYLTAIFDPSRAVEPKYLGYHAELKSGEVLFGVITSESGFSVRLRQLDGTTRELVREHVETLSSSQRSFMPEGFESELNPTDVGHLIAFLRQLK